MKGIDTLIKLCRRQLDALRRKQADLERQKSLLAETSRLMQEELEQEMELAGKQPMMGNFFGNFAERVKKRRAEIATMIAALEESISALANEIAAAFGELKKYEIAKQNRLARERAEMARQETIVLDDIAAEQFRRKEE